ncbi:MAG: class I SAM-dependent methyltransferase [Planctomycetales bacterium]|nr:class I SAM-dependent methyltransferase [bacterium]UNM09947.1 MAG: class I SAM-dependent methyltransferase [Planctomycetales bacterium]
MPSGRLTAYARSFLEQRFARKPDGSYFPHQPLHGLYGESEAGRPLRLARSYRLLRWIEALAPHSLADLGAAEGYIANLVRLRQGCPTLCIDLSLEACRRAAEIHGQPAVASPLQSIPLPDDSVDVVLLSEVFEHLEDPMQVVREMVRVARRYVVITTQEICMSRAEQSIRLRLRELDEAHGELNWLCSADLHSLFSGPSRSVPQFRRSLRRLAGQVSREEAISHLRWLSDAIPRRSEGIIFVASLDGSPVPELPAGDDMQLWQQLLEGPQRATAGNVQWQLADGRTVEEGQAIDSGTSPEQALASETEARPPLDAAGISRLLRRLDTANVSNSGIERRLLSKQVRMMERIGYLTCSDPWEVRSNWLRSRLGPAAREKGPNPDPEASSG